MDRLVLLRQNINEIDIQIQSLLLERFKLVSDVAKIKKELNLPIEDLAFEKIKVEELIGNMINSSDLEKEFFKALILQIMNQSKLIQKDILENK